MLRNVVNFLHILIRRAANLAETMEKVEREKGIDGVNFNVYENEVSLFIPLFSSTLFD